MVNNHYQNLIGIGQSTCTKPTQNASKIDPKSHPRSFQNLQKSTPNRSKIQPRSFQETFWRPYRIQVGKNYFKKRSKAPLGSQSTRKMGPELVHNLIFSMKIQCRILAKKSFAFFVQFKHFWSLQIMRKWCFASTGAHFLQNHVFGIRHLNLQKQNSNFSQKGPPNGTPNQ